MALTNEKKRQQSGRSLRDDMRALAEQQRAEKTLPAIPVRGATPAQRGRADWTDQPTGVPGGGINGPLVERDYDEREYHESVIITGDFLVGLEIKPIKKITMLDADQNEVEFNYDYKAEVEP